MAHHVTQPCPCGSCEPRRELVDAMGVFCAFVCDVCERHVRARYNPDIFDGARYPADEPIEPELSDPEDDRTR